MRITEGQLRQIIREQLEDAIDEEYAGGLGFAYEKGIEPVSSDEEEPQDDDEWQRHVQDRARGAQRYARSGRFKKLAEKHYANLPFPVWTAPYIGNLDDISTVADSSRRCYRMKVMKLGTVAKVTNALHGALPKGMQLSRPRAQGPSDIVPDILGAILLRKFDQETAMQVVDGLAGDDLVAGRYYTMLVKGLFDSVDKWLQTQTNEDGIIIAMPF